MYVTRGTTQVRVLGRCLGYKKEGGKEAQIRDGQIFWEERMLEEEEEEGEVKTKNGCRTNYLYAVEYGRKMDIE